MATKTVSGEPGGAKRPNQEYLNRIQRLRALLAKNLAEFLIADLRLGFTFVALANTERRLGETEAFQRNKRYAIRVIEVIRKLEGQLSRQDTRALIDKRCSELERAVSAL